MYCMYKKIPVDFCDFFLEKCDTVRGRSGGDIGIGGLITLLGVKVGLDFETVVEYALGTDDTIFLTMKVLGSFHLIGNTLDGGLDWYTGDAVDPQAKHPCFRITPNL